MTFLFFNFSVESDRQRAIDGLVHYRDIARPFETHNSLSDSWEHLPYPISPVTWFHYYTLLETILRSHDRDTDIFICGTVMTPFPVVFYEHVRMVVYRMFYRNTPYCVFRFLGLVRFRLLFVSTTTIENRIEFERFRISTTFSDPIYHDLRSES